MNEPTKSDTPRTDEASVRACKQSSDYAVKSYNCSDYVHANFSRQLERELNQSKEEINQAWEECERLRQLVPTTAQHMVYHSLLMKYEALEKELKQWKKCADELHIQLQLRQCHSSKDQEVLVLYNQLKQGEGK